MERRLFFVLRITLSALAVYLFISFFVSNECEYDKVNFNRLPSELMNINRETGESGLELEKHFERRHKTGEAGESRLEIEKHFEIRHKTTYGFDVGEYYKTDLVVENGMVDNLSPLLKSHYEVIYEAQRIHLNMFKTLIGSYKYAMLFNYAAFENKGDPAITVGELKLIKTLGIELILHCRTLKCTAHTLDYARNISRNYSASELVILMHGGGNLLSYEFEDDHRKLVLERFQKFEVILFPQSVWPKAGSAHQKEFQEVYASHPRLTFLYRDRPSYDFGKRNWPKARPFLMPDMAFQIGDVRRFLTPTHDVMWLARNDGESNKYKMPNGTKGYDVLVKDWWGWPTPKGATNLEDAVLMAVNGMLFLQRGRVVVTDRLHGHILSVLCGIPHVIIDPVNHKITSYMKSWTGGIEDIVVANSSEDALDKAIGLLKKLDEKIPKTLAFRNSIENP
ncbi:MAG: polysaccharide pyruvyl transferase family protein [Candidatus Thiodiazotropha sp.]